MDIAATEGAKRRRARRDTSVNLRLTTTVRTLIDTAADVTGKTRTEFMVESAKQQAIDVLLDQRLFALPADQREAFNDALDNPPLPNDQLKELMARTTPPWEK